MKEICLPRRNRPSFGGFLFLEADLSFLNWEFWMINIQSRKQSSRPASRSLENLFLYWSWRILAHPENQPISTSLIHNIASDGKSCTHVRCKQVLDSEISVLYSFLHTKISCINVFRFWSAPKRSVLEFAVELLPRISTFIWSPKSMYITQR